MCIQCYDTIFSICCVGLHAMNKYIVIILLGVVTVVFAESSLKRDKDTLIKGWEENLMLSS